jgi:sugar phosphate isomerase/epimerase
LYTTLIPDAIGIYTKTLAEAVAAAKLGGFASLEVNIDQAASVIKKQGVDAAKALFTESQIQPAVFRLLTDWRGSNRVWRRDLADLPRLAAAARALGMTRTATWFLPFSDSLPATENRSFFRERLTPIAAILADYGISLGLEFVGPRTLRLGHKYEFIHTMEETLVLGAEIGPNVGLLLDSYHWYTSHSTVDAIKSLSAKRVVYVHVNDAPAGVAIDDQLDGVRCIPGETGVIDIVGFLGALKFIGYDGPVGAEPFKKLGSLPSDQARLTTISESLRNVFAAAGVET